MPRPPFSAHHLRALCPPRTPLSFFPRRLLSTAQTQPDTSVPSPEPLSNTQARRPTQEAKVTRILPASLASTSTQQHQHQRPSPSTEHEQSQEQSQQQPGQRKQKPYFVSRTKTNNLPVYEEAKRGGNLKQTLVRRVSGDSETLRAQLASVLEPPAREVRVNGLTGHVVVKGLYKEQVERFLRKSGF